MYEYCIVDEKIFSDKKILLRVDLNSPLNRDDRRIAETWRLEASCETIKYLIDTGASVVIMAHQGRPGSWDFISLKNHAEILSNFLEKDVKFVYDVMGKKALNEIKSLKNGEILMLDNVRKVPQELKKDSFEGHSRSDFVKNLSMHTDIYVNDGFAVAHRAQCSVVGFPMIMRSYAGKLLHREVSTIEKIMTSPEKPFYLILGGAKFSDSIHLIKNLFEKGTADKIIATGLLACAFARGYGKILPNNTNRTISEEYEKNEEKIKEILKKFGDKIYIPKEYGVEVDGKREDYSWDNFPQSGTIKDIGMESVNEILDIISDGKTIFISGPAGVIESEEFSIGTEKIVAAIASSKSFSIAGGGHTTSIIRKMKLEDKFGYMCTGGGALEEFMLGKKLPGLQALELSKKLFGCGD